MCKYTWNELSRVDRECKRVSAVQAEGAHAGPTVPGAGKAGEDGFRPAKLFSIDRVFRNETMDATHLAEFHQVEGVVADRGLTLADLIGMFVLFFHVCSFFSRCVVAMARSPRCHGRHMTMLVGFMRVFFKKMGIENLRFKPAYNPYTEVGDLGFLPRPCLVFGLTIAGGWLLPAGYYVPYCSRPWRSSRSTRSSRSGSRSATLACSGPRCSSQWGSPRTFTYMAGVSRWSARR